MLVVTAGVLLHCPAVHGEVAPAPTTQADAISHQIGRLEEKINELSQKSTSTTSLWIALAALVISGLSVLVSYLNGRKALTQKANDEQAKVIQDRLDRFYGPLRQLLKQSELLYLVLKKRQPDPNNFRALIALLDGAEFVGNDKSLLEEIIRIGGETEKLIKESSGLVDHDLLDILGRATSHYRVMKLAFDMAIKGDTSLFAAYVFPREIGEKLDRAIQSQKEELRRLRAV
jgi:hypothetical protein